MCTVEIVMILVEKVLAIPHLSAEAALAQPLLQTEDEVETVAFGGQREVAVVVEIPARAARQGRLREAAGLRGQEKPEHHRLFHGSGKRALGER
jgi:hypothetical protein